MLGRVLLAAPLLVACRSNPPETKDPLGNRADGGVVAKKECKHDPIDVTGCGGGEV